MKVGLLVKSAGSNEGKLIPIRLPQFVVGRDPSCQLRPSSAAISKRHCALLIADGKVVVRDFNSTNGTFVNDEQVQGDQEVQDGDLLRIGPLDFQVKIEVPAPVAAAPAEKPVAKPKPAAPTTEGEDADIAAMLLLDDDATGPGNDPEGAIPDGSTVMDLNALAASEMGKPAPEPPKPANTAKAADDLLKKMMRRRG